jgi:hypothetical protein
MVVANGAVQEIGDHKWGACHTGPEAAAEVHCWWGIHWFVLEDSLTCSDGVTP